MTNSLHLVCVIISVLTLILTLIVTITPGWFVGKSDQNNFDQSSEIFGNEEAKVSSLDFGFAFFYIHVDSTSDGISTSFTSFYNPLAFWYIALTLFIMITTMIWQLLGIVSTKRAHNFAQYGNTILSKANFRRSAIFMGVGAASLLSGLLLVTVPILVLEKNKYEENAEFLVYALLSTVRFGYSYYLGWVALGASLACTILSVIANVQMKGSNIQHVPMM